MTETNDYGSYDEETTDAPEDFTDEQIDALLDGPQFQQVIAFVEMGISQTADARGVIQIRGVDFISIIRSAAKAAQADVLANLQEVLND